MATLRAISGPAAGTAVEIVGEVVVGREGSHLAIEDSELSRKHVVLRPVAGGVEVEDLRSTNGTTVDGRPLEGRTTVTRDATIEIGSSRLAVELTPSGSPLDSPHATSGSRSSEGPSIEWGIRGAVLAVVAAICAVLIAAQTGDSKSNHRLDATIRTAILDEQGANTLFVGSATGKPGGRGASTIDQIFSVPAGQRPLATGVRTGYSAKIITRFDDGSFTATIRGTAVRQSDGRVAVTGRGEFIDGTGRFDGATGTFTQTGGRPSGSDHAEFRLVGTLRY